MNSNIIIKNCSNTACLQFNKPENENEQMKLDIICNSITIGNWKIQTEDVGEKQVLVIRDTKSQNDSRYAFWPDTHSNV